MLGRNGPYLQKLHYKLERTQVRGPKHGWRLSLLKTSMTLSTFCEIFSKIWDDQAGNLQNQDCPFQHYGQCIRYSVHSATVVHVSLCEIASALNTCKINGQQRVMFNRIVNINCIITKLAAVGSYTCMIVCKNFGKKWTTFAEVTLKNSNGPKFADPRTSDDRLIFKTSMINVPEYAVQKVTAIFSVFIFWWNSKDD